MSNEINELKVRLFDTQEYATLLKTQNQELSNALQIIAQKVGLSPDENQRLDLQTIVDTVGKSLTVTDESTEVHLDDSK